MMATDLSRSRDMESPAEEAGPSVASAHPATPQQLPANKIIGRNLNGTMVVTSAPCNEAELQLYRVMQRASLLVYYDTLLEMGGDDVRQLCEAGEEEFLEIMALVGMAPKPLHVRRLQKALQEWVSNPALFQIPIVPNMCPTDNPFVCNQRFLGVPPIIPGMVASPEGSGHVHSPSPGTNDNSNPAVPIVIPPSPSPAFPLATTPHNQSSPAPSQSTITRIVLPSSVAPTAPVTTSASRAFSPQSGCPPSTNSSPGSGSIQTPVASPTQNPILLETHVQKLALAAEKLTKTLPQPEPRPQNSKKKMCRDLELVMMMPESNPRRMEEIRKYAAIYGRFDCKRKPEKPLTLHEMMVNEAAAQLCRCVPAMLSRRDELFPLARQLVRRAGLHHSKYGPSSGDDGQDEEWQMPTKRKRQTNRYQRSTDEDEEGPERGSPEAARGAAWWPVKTESDDTDSRCSYSSASTPPPDTEDSRPQVVAARGDSIIAVANPALQPPPLPPARNHSN